MATDKFTVTIRADGTTEFIHDDELAAALTQTAESVSTRRASHVEPGDPACGQDASRWYADMKPVGGPLLDDKGDGFATRGAALKAEVEWLNANYL